MWRNYRYITPLTVVICLAAISYGGIINGDFELAEPNEELGFDPPYGWERENYAAVVDRFIPDPCNGNYVKWSIDTNEGLLPAMGEKFVVLSTGDVSITSSLIRQQVYIYPGDSISGYYFFGTCDYIHYYDYGTIKLVPADSNSGPNNITLVYIDVGDVDSDANDRDGKSMEGWEYFEYTFGQDEGGTYELVIKVEDHNDLIYESYLAVDGLALCERPPYGDINHDCMVNLKDFSWMATDWLRDCSDPNYLLDPNNNCQWGTDIDGNGPVDVNDLMLLTDYWLFGP